MVRPGAGQGGITHRFSTFQQGRDLIDLRGRLDMGSLPAGRQQEHLIEPNPFIAQEFRRIVLTRICLDRLRWIRAMMAGMY